MKKVILIFGSLIASFGLGHAQYAGQFQAASTVPKGASQLGAYVGILEDGFGILGQYRYGIGGYTDIGGKLGILSLDAGPDDSQAAMLLSLDAKYQVLEVRIKDPFDLSIGGKLDLLVAEYFNFYSLGIYGVGSYPVALHSGKHLTPYGRLLLRVDRVNPEHVTGDTEFDLGLNAGCALELTERTQIMAEFQFDPDQFGFYMGFDFGL